MYVEVYREWEVAKLLITVVVVSIFIISFRIYIMDGIHGIYCNLFTYDTQNLFTLIILILYVHSWEHNIFSVAFCPHLSPKISQNEYRWQQNYRGIILCVDLSKIPYQLIFMKSRYQKFVHLSGANKCNELPEVIINRPILCTFKV